MNTKGLSLPQLAAVLDEQRKSIRDFIVDTNELSVEPDDESPSRLTLQVGKDESFPIRPHAVRQFGEQLGIPAKFANRLAEKYPDMLAYNINGLLEREPARRRIRTLDGNCRAYLSDKYRPLDNFDFAEAVLPKLIENKASVTSCEVTETRMFIKAIIPGVEKVVSKPGAYLGDGGHSQIHRFSPGICLSNSETGDGSLAIEPGVHEWDCTNLVIVGRNAMRKYHVGRKNQLTDIDTLLEVVFSDATKTASDRAFWMQVADLVQGALDGTIFERMVAECEAKMSGIEIGRPSEAIKELPNLSLAEQDGILASLIRGGDLSQFGLQWAVTHFAQTASVPYARQVELERLGGEIIELPKTDWTRIAEAA